MVWIKILEYEKYVAGNDTDKKNAEAALAQGYITLTKAEAL